MTAIHKRQFGTAVLKKQGYGVMSKTNPNPTPTLTLTPTPP